MITNNSSKFGGKLILFSGDFKQILPVVPRGSRGMMVNACLKSSSLFPKITSVKLSTNVMLEALRRDKFPDSNSLEYPRFLLDVGEGNLHLDQEECITIPTFLDVVDTISSLIEHFYSDIHLNFQKKHWLISRTILATSNARLHEINDEIGNLFSGVFKTYLSADSVKSDDDTDLTELELKIPHELLNSIEASASFPSTKQYLKKVSLLCFFGT